MRIVAIRGKNLASLAEPFEILLNAGALEQAGLFAITGATGAGKSTILDALCLALYDKIPRLPDGHGFAIGHKDEAEQLRVTSNDVRSILRRGTSHAYAEVDFIGRDKHPYRARWEVSKARGRAEGRLQAQEVSLCNITTGQRIGQGKRDTLEIISNLIDLTFDQFRRSVLLAQGDFAAFLQAKKDERSSLLERITGTELYSELSIAAFERARQEKDTLNQIVNRLHDQIPLDEAARILLEQQRDHCSEQLITLDKQIVSNQTRIDWYVELKKLQAAEHKARDVFNNSRQRWDATDATRQLISSVEAAQPLRPLLSQYQTATAEHLDAQQKLTECTAQQTAVALTLQNAKAQLDTSADLLMTAERQQQQAQPLLTQARVLDTHIDVIQKTVSTLTTEARKIQTVLNDAEKAHRSLLTQQTEQALALQQLNQWLEQHQAIKPIAAEWRRWEAELERYQTLNTRNTDAELKAAQLRLTIAKNARSLTELQREINDRDLQREQQEETLLQLRNQENQQQSFEDLLHFKEALTRKREQVTLALHLANTAQTLQQAIQQDTDKLAATEQTLNDHTLQLQVFKQQQLHNGMVLSEAKKALELIQATTHKNAEQFRTLLQDNQPCPVCGALEHLWKDHVTIGNEHAMAQSTRVTELENQHVTMIKTIATLTQASSQAQEQKTTLTHKLTEAKTNLTQCSNDWLALALLDKPHFAIVDALLLPALKRQDDQVTLTLAEIKPQEAALLSLQKQLKATQKLYDTAKLHKEKLAIEHAVLDKQQTQNNADLEHLISTIQELQTQLHGIITLLATPFRSLENWQTALHESVVGFKQDCAAKVQHNQRTEQQITTLIQSLEKLNHDAKLAEQTLNQTRQHSQLKQSELTIQTATLQKLTQERDTVLPNSGKAVTADEYEQTIAQSLLTASAAQQQAAKSVNQAETALATHKQHQQHWQTETDRRYNNLEKAQHTIKQVLAKQAIDLEQLTALLKKAEPWLAEQKASMAALERTLHESSVLLNVKTDACRHHQIQVVDSSEEDVTKLSLVLQQQRQVLHTQKEEQVFLLREDAKKIAAGQLLKAELDDQQQRWAQWESLNELIGSKNGVKFRVFAQSLTLEALLAHSNQHLQDFARRYALQRVPDSDLELQIIDRDMADDVRSVHSLSGGESFLVSLALALGLASLSSNTTQVESLFIDEGFGSLDPETLDIAIASLDTLQALGRKVGVISHVPILVERIGAKVVVEKLGGGRSRVVVAGGY